jgi:hypothetical protein
MDSRYNLITGAITVPTKAELQQEEYMTAVLKQQLGECDCACRYTEPFGWVPEADCPVHDRA